MKRWILLILFAFPMVAHADSNPPACDTAYEKISKADPVGFITNAFFQYCPVGAPLDKEYVQMMLRDASMRLDTELNRRILKNVEKSGADLPGFYKMIEEATIWSENEKAKSAEEIYQASKIYPPDVKKYEWEDAYREAFLMEAAKRGHEKARQELEELGMTGLLKPVTLPKNWDSGNH